MGRRIEGCRDAGIEKYEDGKKKGDVTDLIRAVSLERHCSGVELSSGGRDISSDIPANSYKSVYYSLYIMIQ